MKCKPPEQIFYGPPFVDKGTIALVSVGTRIRSLRKEKNWKLRELAEASGVPASTISDLERGRSMNSVGDTLVKLAAALGVEPEWLQTGDGPMGKSGAVDDTEILRLYGLLTPANREAVLATAKALLSSQATAVLEDDPPGPRPRKLQ